MKKDIIITQLKNKLIKKFWDETYPKEKKRRENNPLVRNTDDWTISLEDKCIIWDMQDILKDGTETAEVLAAVAIYLLEIKGCSVELALNTLFKVGEDVYQEIERELDDAECNTYVKYYVNYFEI